MSELRSSPVSSEDLEAIDGSWTLGRLKKEYPAVELALFAHFGVGSRERSGFAKEETLSDLMRRHLVFDVEGACRRLFELAREDRAWSVEPHELALERTREGGALAVDCRSQAAFQTAHLSGAALLGGGLVSQLRAAGDKAPAVVCCCQDGSQAPAASRHLRGLGLRAFHLRGGLHAWALEVDPGFPILYPVAEVPGRWYLLADDRTLRYRFPTVETPVGTDSARWRLWQRADGSAERRPRAWVELLERCSDLQTVALSPRSLAFVWSKAPGLDQLRAVAPWAEASLWSEGGQLSCPDRERRRLVEALAREAPEILGNHKGTVELADYRDRVAYLALGGGCAGCASAEVTTQRELAGCLYRAVPLLDRIESLA